jgi:DNA polymerase I-like protein with 3'-5' exonuclease and polymerase domains
MKRKTYLVSDRYLEHISFSQIQLEQVELGDLSTLDLETTGLRFNYHSIIFVIVGTKETQYVIDYNFVDVEKLKILLSRPKIYLGHNLSFDLPFLIERGFNFNTGQVYDSMETELTLVKGTMHSVSLQNTLKRRLGVDDLDKGITMEFTRMSATNPHFEDRHIEYAYKDVLHLEDLREEQLRIITKLKQNQVVKYNNEMVVVVSYMKVTGMPLNKDKWMDLYYANLKRCDELEIELDGELNKLGLIQKARLKIRCIQTDLLGGGTDVVNVNKNHINYASPDQIKDIFSHFNQPIPKVNKKVNGKQVEKDTTGTKELEDYLLSRPKSILKGFLLVLIQYRVYSKRVSTYGKSFLEEHLTSKGRVHPDFKINRTATGRMSSNNPNAQNIPALKEFRECFEVVGTDSMFTCDLSSAELRILASLADDKVLKGLYENGEDLHSYLATPAFRYLKDDPTFVVSKKQNSELRTLMKTVNFGIAYGASASKVGKVLNVSKQKAERVLEIMKLTIPATFKFLEKQEWTGQNIGIVKFDNVWNQVRYFEQVAKGEEVTKEALSAIGREAKNCAIQGVNGQMIKLALVNIFNYIREHNLKSRIISAVHDEVIIEVVEGEEDHCDNYKLMMEVAGDFFLEGVKMEAEGGLNKCWSK